MDHNKAFVPCPAHRQFTYICHPCLVATVGKLCEMLDEDIVTPERLEAIDRNARAYGWEIGHGAKIETQINTTEGNPFLKANWRQIYGGAQFRVGFVDYDDKYHVHMEEFVGNEVMSKTINTSMCPTCEVSNGTDGAPEGGDQPTGKREDTVRDSGKR